MRSALVLVALVGIVGAVGCGAEAEVEKARAVAAAEAEDRGRRSSCCVALLGAIEKGQAPSRLDPREREYLLGPGGWSQEDLRWMETLCGLARANTQWDEGRAFIKDRTLKEIQDAMARGFVTPAMAWEDLMAQVKTAPAGLVASLEDGGAGGSAGERVRAVVAALRADDLARAREALRRTGGPEGPGPVSGDGARR